MKQLEKNQLNIFNQLIDLYEGRNSYGKDDIKMKRVGVKPEKILSGYGGRFADIDKDERLTLDMLELEELGYVTLERDKKSNVICRIYAKEDKWDDYYAITKRKKKINLIKEYIAEYEAFMKKYKDNAVIIHICQEMLGKLHENKLPGDNSHADTFQRNATIISLIEHIMNNEQTLYIREFSQKYLGDTKLFSKSYIHTVCKYIYDVMDWKSKLPGLSMDENSEKTLLEYIILGEYQIYPNPVYVYINGDIKISFDDGSVLQTKKGLPVAISSEAINNIKDIKLSVPNIITIENKTSFSRFNEQDTLAIYLEGYNSSSVSEFIKILNKYCKNVKWFHFGDLDPDGFYILEHLKRTTGIAFIPKYMDLETLCRYKIHGKKLEKNDITKAENLIKAGVFPDIIGYMLQNNIKLEQEIISYELH